jgi:hypothetical protein
MFRARTVHPAPVKVNMEEGVLLWAESTPGHSDSVIGVGEDDVGRYVGVDGCETSRTFTQVSEPEWLVGDANSLIGYYGDRALPRPTASGVDVGPV